MFQVLRYPVLLFLLFVSTGSHAQISVSPNQGCMPIGITNANFTYLGPAASSLLWNFGDGSPTSNLNAPQHSYLNVGNYIVSCTAQLSGGPQTYTFQVSVYPSPTGGIASVGLASSGCAPRAATLTASGPQNPNYSYVWSFGDQTQGNGFSTSHAYAFPGTFTPGLTITDQNTNCSFFTTWTGAPVKVSGNHIFNLIASPGTFSCTAPFVVTFNANGSISGSPNGGILNLTWNFGNSQNGTGYTPPPQTYGAGVFTVTLSGTDDNNCTQGTSQLISVVTPSILSLSAPPALCVASQMPHGPPPFNPFGIWSPYVGVGIVTTETTSYWNMGDGSPPVQFPWNSTTGQPIPIVPNTPTSYSLNHLYYMPGPKIVTVTVTKNGCVDSKTLSLFVEEIQPAFATSPHVYTCSPTIVANYTNFTTTNYTGTLTYTWTVTPFDENSNTWMPAIHYTTAVTNPTFNFTQGSLNPYTRFKVYKPQVHLLVRSPVGCVTTTVHVFDSIRRPTALFFKDKSEGCAPLAVTFSNVSETNTTFFPITSYTWYGGASPSQTVGGSIVPPATISPVVFTYTAPGTYSAYLTINTQGGCTHTSFMHTITVVNPPQIAITPTPNLSVCAGVPIQVSLTSSSLPPPQHWHLESGNNYFSGCVSDSMPAWSYPVPGVYGFTVQAYLNSCSNTAVSNMSVTVSGPAAALQYETNCTNKKSVKFDYVLMDATSATLNFGDGSPPALLAGGAGTVANTITHLYPSKGDYTATLIASKSSGTCSPFTQTVLVKVREPLAEFTYTNTFCSGEWVYFIADTASDNVVGGGMGYHWTIQFPNPAQDSISILDNDSLIIWFYPVGTYTMNLMTRDINGCEDTTSHTFRVAKPVPSFTFNSNPICYSDLPLQLINTTTQTPDAVQNFTWMIGPPLNTGPFPAVDTAVTSNATFTYNAFNMLGQSTQTFDIKLEAKDAIGCIDSIRHRIQVNNPQAYLYPVNNICLPPGTGNFSFFNAPSYTGYTLQLGNGINPLTVSTPTAAFTFTQHGLYSPTVTVKDAAGCHDVFPKTNQLPTSFSVVTKPIANFDYGSTTNSYCKQIGSAITVTLNSTSFSNNYPVYHWWNFGVPPFLGPGTNTSPAQPYDSAGVYVISLQLIGSAPNCMDTKSVTVTIEDRPQAQASAQNTLFCMGSPIVVTMSGDSGVHHWQWDFGANVPTPVFFHPMPKTIPYSYPSGFFPNSTNGKLRVILTVYAANDSLCRSIDTFNVKMVRVIPGFNRNNELSLSDYAHCLGVTDTFSNTSTSNSSAMTFTWTFGDGNTNYQVSPQHVYTQPGTYSVVLQVLTTEALCEAFTSKSMTIFPNPSATLNVQDLACPDSLFLVSGSGIPGVSGMLTATLTSPLSSQTLNLAPNNSFSLQSSASSTSVFSLTVSDENLCRNSPVTDTIHIQLAPPVVNTSTTIIVGQTVTINGFIGNNYLYHWTQDTSYLSCTACYNPVSTTTNNITYTLGIIDQPLGCFEVFSQHSVIVRMVASIDVPTAFTPNGDGVNDFILPDGWGIRKLIYFKVFNRWGQLLFESNDLDRGWDGTFNGVPQNMETYIYQAAVDTYTDETLTKTGSFKLIR